MKELIKRMTLTISSLLMIALPIGMPVAIHAQADIEGSLCEGANLQIGETNCDTDDPQGTVNGLITTVINIFSVVVGVVAVVMIIIGGFKYITSGGDSGGVTSAKNTVLFAIVGLIVVALAQIIVRFVLTEVDTDSLSG